MKKKSAAKKTTGKKATAKKTLKRTTKASPSKKPAAKKAAVKKTVKRAAAKKRAVSSRTLSKRDLVKDYPLSQFIEKIRRLADALESGKQFTIQVANAKITVPAHAKINIEHELDAKEEELEFQLVWKR